MDIIVSYFAMPVGVAFCFGPAVVVWWLTEGRKEQSEKKPGDK